MAIDLARLVVKLEAEIAQYARKLDEANAKLDRFGKKADTTTKQIEKAFKALSAGYVVREFERLIKSAIDGADAANKFSQQVGVSTETITGLELAANLAGVTMKDVEVGLRRLGRAMSDANQGLSTQKRAFEDLGISYKDSSGKLRAVDEVLREIADKFASMEDGARKVARAQELLGRSGSLLIPLFNSGSEGIEKYIEVSRQLGVVWTQETAKAAEDFNDRLTIMETLVEGTAAAIARDMLPALNDSAAAWTIFNTRTREGGTIGTALSYILKGATGAVITISAAVESLSKRLAALAAAAVKAIQLDWESVFRINTDAERDLAQIQNQWLTAMERLWGSEEDKKRAQDFVDQINEILSQVGKGRGDGGDENDGLTNAVTRQIEALKLQAEVLGKSATEAAVYKLKVEGATEAEQEAARAYLEKIAAYKQTEGIDAQVAALQEQAKLLGDSATAVTLYKLQQDGANDSQLEAARAALEMIDAYNEAKKAAEELADAQAAARAKRDRETSEFESVYESLQTAEERIQASYDRRLAIIKRHTEEASELQRELINRLEAQTEEALEKLNEKTDDMSVFAEQAARNIQDAFAEFLFDPFEDGLEGMLLGFLNIIRRMAAEAAAAKIFEALFPKKGEGGDGGSALGDILGGIFGGGRAVGGEVSPGHVYEVGERGREYFVPHTAGNIVPFTGGGVNVVQNIDARGASNPAETQRAMYIAKEQAKGEIIELLKRGRL